MSALPPKADMCSALGDVRLVPIADIAPSHSITSSARASSEGGTVRPSALAVLRLITSSYFVRRLHRKFGRFLALRECDRRKSCCAVKGFIHVWVHRKSSPPAGDEVARMDRRRAADAWPQEQQPVVCDAATERARSARLAPPFGVRANCSNGALNARSASRTSIAISSTPERRQQQT